MIKNGIIFLILTILLCSFVTASTVTTLITREGATIGTTLNVGSTGTFTGNVTAPNFIGSLDYGYLTNPPVIVNTSENISFNFNDLQNITCIQFNTSLGVDISKMCWNVASDTIDVYTASGQVIQVGRELGENGINKEGRTLPDGTFVSISGAQGDNPTFIAADSTNVSRSLMIGVLTRECLANEVCPVVVFGFANDLDTSLYSIGEQIYINPNEPGNWTSTTPVLPNNPVWVATVIRVHANEGRLFVFPKIDPSDGFLINSIWATGNVRVIGNITANESKAAMDWSYLKSYPSSCPAGTAITQLDDSVTCTAFSTEINTYSSGNFIGSIYTSGTDSSSSDSNALFMVMSDTRGTPQLSIQDGGPNQASFIARSFMVVNQNNTLLNSSQNNVCSDWGFIHIDCNTSTTGADFGVTDDIETQGLVYANEGYRGHAAEHSAYIALADIPQLYNGANGEFNDANNIFCDYTSDNFVEKGWVIILDEEHEYNQAFADISGIINSSCVELQHNPAWDSDFTGAAWVVKNNLNMISQDGGFFEFYIGDDVESRFRIKNNNATGVSTFNVATIMEDDDHNAIDVEVDINGYTGSVAHHIFMKTSVALEYATSKMLLLEGDGTGFSNSEMTFIDINLIGAGDESNIINGIKMPPDISTLISVGSADELSAAYYNSVNVTYNFTNSSSNGGFLENQNDYIYIGNTGNFTNIGFALDVGSSKDLALEYYYCNRTGDYVVLPIGSDSTSGMQNGGSISFTNPSDRGVCNTEFDGTPFSDTTDYTYIAIKRTLNVNAIDPIENIITISGASSHFILNEGYVKWNLLSSPPLTCGADTEGTEYYDVDIHMKCTCTGANFVQNDDWTTTCS